MESINVMDLQKVKSLMKEQTQKKSESLIKIGVACYEQVRNNKTTIPDINEAITTLKNADKIIYYCNKRMDELIVKTPEKCSCGHTITSEDKFCGGCGAVVNVKINNDLERKNCSSCNEDIVVSSNFCPYCGYIQN